MPNRIGPNGPWQACFHFATYLPRFIPAPRWGFASFVNLRLCLAVGTLAGTLLFLLRATHINYSRAYLWMRALLRYRLALALLAHGLLKVFSLQFPLPTVSELNTQYGDLMQWKIYYLTVGVGKMGYQPLIGWLEVGAALLLLWNRTATIGACLSAAMLTNIVPANFAYQFGDHLFASTLMLFSVIIAAHDGWRLLQLLVLMASFAGGRKYLFYDYDLSKQPLFLQDKNILTAHERQLHPGTAAVKGWKPAKLLTWHYTIPAPGRVTISGIDEDGATIDAELQRIDEQQAIHIDSPIQGQPLHYGRTFYRRIPMSDKSFDGYGASPAQDPK